MQRVMHRLLILCVSSWALSISAGLAPAGSVQQTDSAGPVAHTIKGRLRTSRVIQSANRRLSQQDFPQGSDSGDDTTWLVGLPADQQAEVYKTLTEQCTSFRILHPVPSGGEYFWLVKGTSSCIQAALDRHADMTATQMPHSYKASPLLDRVVQLCIGQSRAACQDKVNALHKSLEMSKGGKIVVTVLAPGASSEEMASLSDQAENALTWLGQQQEGCGVAVRIQGAALLASTCPADVQAVAGWFTQKSIVSWVDLQRRRSATSNLHAGAVAQAPSQQVLGSTPPNDLLAPSGRDTFFPYWQSGLNGSGQIIGMVDTGLDLDSCYLWDPKFTDYQNGSSTSFVPPNNSSRLNNFTRFYNMNHRKVVYYGFISDKVDDPVGHGTHVAATLVGSRFGVNASRDLDLGTGLAHGAKIAIMDVGNSTNNLADGGRPLDTGLDYSRLWDPLRLLGVRVTSNSWGQDTTDNYVYNQPICYMLDAYTWAFQDTLHVFAAGNGGYQTGYISTGTAEAPSTCKNTLAVGATEAWIEKGLGLKINATAPSKNRKLTGNFRGPWDHGQITVSSQDGKWSMVLDSAATDFAPLLGFDSRFDKLKGKTVNLVITEPRNLCVVGSKWTRPTIPLILTPLNNAECTLGASVRNAITQGAVGVLVALIDQAQTILVNVSSAISQEDTFPAATVRYFLGQRIVRYMTANGTSTGLNTTLRLTWKRTPPLLAPHENVAYFSAYSSLANDETSGPDFADRRFKPDVLAPGYTISASSDGKFSGKMDKCDTATTWGTSMAAPIASASGAIIRQYFQEGWYPGGFKGSGRTVDPSGPLVKAVIIAGTLAMKGVSRANNQPLEPPPSPFQGFGRVHLASSLPRKGDTLGYRLQVLDQVLFNDDGISHTYPIAVNETRKPLIVTLVWHDFPGFPGATQVLVNNLNLRVVDPSGTTFWGNNYVGGDPFNNVEKVYIANPKVGNYRVIVDAVNLFIAARPQPYSLVALGGLKGFIASPYNPSLPAWPSPANVTTTRRRRPPPSS